VLGSIPGSSTFVVRLGSDSLAGLRGVLMPPTTHDPTPSAANSWRPSSTIGPLSQRGSLDGQARSLPTFCPQFIAKQRDGVGFSGT
jgi:hypothetical protein